MSVPLRTPPLEPSRTRPLRQPLWHLRVIRAELITGTETGRPAAKNIFSVALKKFALEDGQRLQMKVGRPEPRSRLGPPSRHRQQTEAQQGGESRHGLRGASLGGGEPQGMERTRGGTSWDQGCRGRTPTSRVLSHTLTHFIGTLLFPFQSSCLSATSCAAGTPALAGGMRDCRGPTGCWTFKCQLCESSPQLSQKLGVTSPIS